MLCHVFLIGWLEIYVVDEHIWYLDWEVALLNDWDTCWWWEYMILGWRDGRWICDAWFAYVHKSDSCSYECETWIDGFELMWWLFDLIVHCGVIMFDEQCVLVMQRICAFDWMLEVYVVDENMLQCLVYVPLIEYWGYMLLTRVCDAWIEEWACDVWIVPMHGWNLCKYDWWNWIEMMTMW